MNTRAFVWIIFFALNILAVYPQETTYVIRTGDTLYSVARKYGVSYQSILQLNDIKNPEKIYVGQKIRIPSASKDSPSDNQNYRDHRVQKGETLFGIARESGISVTTLRSINRLPDTYVLKEGTILKVPANGGSETAAPSPTSASGSSVASSSTVVANPNAVPIPTVTAGPSVASTSAETATGQNTGTVSSSGPATDARPTVPKTVDPSITWPVPPKTIAYMTGKLYGVVIGSEKSQIVKSLSPGTVVSAGPYRGFGRVVIVQAPDKLVYVYGGCDTVLVKVGDRISSGSQLGTLGVDGVSQEAELFFLVYKDNAPIDPAKAPRY